MPNALEKLEEVSPQLVAVALSDDRYWRRIWQSIVWQTEEYVKKDFTYSLVAACFLGFLTLLDGSASMSTLYWSGIGFLAAFGARLGQHAISAVALTDRAVRKELASSEQRYQELTKYKIVFEIDEALTRVRLHNESPTVVRVTANIALYFISKDQNDWSLKRLDVTLHRLQPGSASEIYAYHFMRYTSGNNQPIGGFERMLIQGGTKSETYIATAHISIGDEVKSANELDSLCFLRVTMTATSNQPPLEADVFLNWEDALSELGARPTFIAGVETINKITDRRIG
jgi:hypothetical protein